LPDLGRFETGVIGEEESEASCEVCIDPL